MPSGSRVPARRTQEERSAATQNLLLDATIDCVVELGYAGASTTAICERAGVSRGAQLHHYPTKAALVAAAIERLFAERHREFSASLGGAPDLEAAVRRLWEIYTGKTFYAWVELLVASRTDPELRDHLRRVDEAFFAQATRTCCVLLGLDADDAGKAAALARLVLSMLDGLALHYMLGGRSAVVEQVLASVPEVLALAARSLAPAARQAGAAARPARTAGRGHG